MASVVSGFEYDVFISYRHNDNRSGWVTEFVKALQEELASTIKEPISVYFDTNPHDGLLETHNVNKSLEGKLKCLVFIPILSQTYCDPKSFAWQHELVAFNKHASGDPFGRDIKLSNGNVASRILPIKIHDLDEEDKTLLENELAGVLRAIEFIFNSTGVSRPLTEADKREENANKTLYRDQINKTARAIKELIGGIQHSKSPSPPRADQPAPSSTSGRKMISRIMAVILLIGLFSFGCYYFMGFGANIAPIDRSIAVLPFDDMSPQQDQEYFSDGMTDEVLNRLFKIGDLRVISRTSSMKFKHAKLTAREIAGQLGVANLLEGSVQKAGNRVKVTVQLIDANNDNHLWSETYERVLDDVFLIQSEIAQAVANELRVKLSAATRTSFLEVPTQNQVAYEYFLRGNQESDEDVENAITLYTKALEEDSLFAEARFTRLNQHLKLFWFRVGEKEQLDEHLVLAKKDLQFLKDNNPQSSSYKKGLALHLYWVDRKYEEASKLFQEIQREYPSDYNVLEFASLIRRRQGHWDEAIEGLEQCLKSDPLSSDYMFQLALLYNRTHQPEKAAKVVKFGISISPRDNGLRWMLAASLIDMGYDIGKARKESGLTDDDWAWGLGADIPDKGSIAYLDHRRKEGRLVRSNQAAYLPITRDYALVYFLSGDRALAKVYADSAATSLLHLQSKMPDDPRLYGSLGECYALAGNEKLAVQNGMKAIELLPMTVDASDGADYELNMVKIFIMLGKYDLALDKIEMLLAIPSPASVGWMMVEPIYEALRNLPRFKKLAEKYRYRQ